MNPRKSHQSQLKAVLASTYWRAKDAEVVLEAWRKSGLPLSRFAEEHGVSRSRLMRWRSRLKKKEPPIHFHPVRVIAQSDTEQEDTLELIVRGGRRVSVRRGFDAALLEELVRLVESWPC